MLGDIGRAGIRAIDLALQCHYHIFAFTDDPACILKIALTVSAHDVDLSDQTHIAKGEPILELHFWNERLPALPRGGGTLRWGIDFVRLVRHSLGLLANYLSCEPRFDAVRALHGELGFVEADQFLQVRLLVRHLGFEFQAGDAPGLRIWRHAFWQNVFSWWLMWAFNPASLRRKDYSAMARGELWISRATLMRKFKA